MLNEVKLKGTISQDPKGGISKEGAFHLSFVLAVPKSEDVVKPNFRNTNYIACMVWGPLAKAQLEKGQVVEITGKINTYKFMRRTFWQVVVEDIAPG